MRDFNDYNYTVVRDTYNDNYIPKKLEDVSNLQYSVIEDYIIVKLELNNSSMYDYHKEYNISLDSSILNINSESYDISTIIPKNHMIYHPNTKIIPSETYISVYIPVFSLTLRKVL